MSECHGISFELFACTPPKRGFFIMESDESYPSHLVIETPFDRYAGSLLAKHLPAWQHQEGLDIS
jgi:hypothetical protein